MKKLIVMFIAFSLVITIAYPSLANGQGIHGNSQGNLANYGYITEDKDWYYYSDGSIYKVRKNGKNKTKLIDGLDSNTVMPAGLTLVGNYLYYTDLMGSEPNANMGIHRLDLKTKKEQLVYGMNARDFKIIGNKIYFIAYDNFNNYTQSIYVTDLNGKNKKKLTGSVSSFTSDGNYLYYQTYNGFYRATLDNKSKVKLTSSEVTSPIISGKTIYFINSSDKKRLYKMSIDGKSTSTLTTNTFDNIFILGDKVLYATRNKKLAGWADYRLGSVKNGKLNGRSTLFTVKYP
ncbi:DUF5050 domain-containing protein [Bacillus sp. JJ722]|uniref:DUF5050 domain-containing protein n=1 Tax=Bacillus sp. JJ722 TaxID=3122973 RepID=UPI002FFE845B